METLLLDFSNCKYFLQVHEELKKTFDLPDYYGKNLDALWDCLEYYFDEPTHVYVKGFYSLPKNWMDHMKKILEVFDDVHAETPNFTYEIVS